MIPTVLRFPPCRSSFSCIRLLFCQVAPAATNRPFFCCCFALLLAAVRLCFLCPFVFAFPVVASSFIYLLPVRCTAVFRQRFAFFPPPPFLVLLRCFCCVLSYGTTVPTIVARLPAQRHIEVFFFAHVHSYQ